MERQSSGGGGGASRVSIQIEPDAMAWRILVSPPFLYNKGRREDEKGSKGKKGVEEEQAIDVMNRGRKHWTIKMSWYIFQDSTRHQRLIKQDLPAERTR